MAAIRSEKSILEELDSLQKKMMQVMVRLTGIGNQ